MVHFRISAIKYLGGVALGIGLLWFGLSSPRPGWKALSAALPDWMISNQASLVLAGFGALLLVLGDRLASRSRSDHSKVQNNGSDDTKKRPETSARWDQFEEERLNAERKKGEEFIGRSQERVALRPCWPQHETSSWVGGLPKLPEQMDWPNVGSRPATFLAQISLADLPETLWQGAGPRTGWLVFWAGDDDTQTRARSIVQHVTGPLEERPQPSGVAPNWHMTMAPKGLEAALGDAGKSPARWYLERVDGPALGAVEDMMSENPSYYNEDLGEWIWEETWTSKAKDHLDQVVKQEMLRSGVDWPSLRGLVRIWHETVLKDMHDLKNQIANEDRGLQQVRAPLEQELQLLKDNPEAEKASFEEVENKLSIIDAKFKAKMDRTRETLSKAQAALEAAEKVEIEIGTLEQETPFSPELGKGKLATLNGEYPATSGFVSRDSQHFIENYARYLYTLDQNSVPDALFRIFAPFWELQCRETLIFVGRNLEGKDGMQTDARLIDFPPHPLAGLTFADGKRFYSDLPLRDLVQENWQEASSTVHYG